MSEYTIDEIKKASDKRALQIDKVLEAIERCKKELNTPITDISYMDKDDWLYGRDSTMRGMSEHKVAEKRLKELDNELLLYLDHVEIIKEYGLLVHQFLRFLYPALRSDTVIRDINRLVWFEPILKAFEPIASYKLPKDNIDTFMPISHTDTYRVEWIQHYINNDRIICDFNEELNKLFVYNGNQ